ncbi:FAD-dependent oxidoreductase domain-containing protein 2 [Trichoplax sp. H2]|nr:FAD-dependent oxidoreductase domain-containing protein 2 [Trichoplax sp. H2]|eukprot:RDD41254.1 FAD-dependent oxidoreductase domain-containing protein 2 [Trichoplax sp. H2]
MAATYLYLIVTIGCLLSAQAKIIHHQYCIIGSGPGGLQMAYFFKRANRDYTVFERSNISGSFFRQYPRHRRLLSINKNNTGSKNSEFNLRHDWNSLLSDNNSLIMPNYSDEYYPHADEMIRYLNDYANVLQLNIQYNTEIIQISRAYYKNSLRFKFKTSKQSIYMCDVAIISTGLATPNIPSSITGLHHAMGYETMSTNTSEYVGQNILILGQGKSDFCSANVSHLCFQPKNAAQLHNFLPVIVNPKRYLKVISYLVYNIGNSAFETAESLSSVSNILHLYGRNRIRLATSTHYIGDIRAKNTKVIDSYQLKTLDGLLGFLEIIFIAISDDNYDHELEGDMKNVGFFKNKRNLIVLGLRAEPHLPFLYDLTGGSKEYHRIIRCLGFRYDRSIFSRTANPKSGEKHLERYPSLLPNYESISVPNMFFAGALTHSLDYRHSGGCCIQGFRYTARALHRLLEWRYHQIPWPSTDFWSNQITDYLITRINQASGLYQMFATLADVILIKKNGQHHYLEDVPVRILPNLREYTGRKIIDGFITLTFEYGKGFSKPGKDTLAKDNYSHSAKMAHKSRNIHPVIRYYKQSIEATTRKGRLPKANKIHHVVEDFLTDWSVYSEHGHYLKLFIENLFRKDLNQYYTSSCYELSMTFKSLPGSCKRQCIQNLKSSTMKL